MISRSLQSITHTATLALLVSSLAHAAEVRVTTAAELSAAVKSLQAGDTVLLAAGEWKDIDIAIKGSGTSAAPITVKAEKPGAAIVTGASAVRLGGDYKIGRAHV